MTCKDYGNLVAKMLREGVSSTNCPKCGDEVKVSMHVRSANSKLEFDNMLYLNHLKLELEQPRRIRR